MLFREEGGDIVRAGDFGLKERSKRRRREVLRSLGSKLPERGYCSLHFPGEIHMLVVDFGYEYQRVLHSLELIS